MSSELVRRVLARAAVLGLNQSALARKIGKTPQDITNWKTRGVPAEHHALLADALNWSVDELLGRSVITLQAQPVTLDAITVVPTISWETLVDVTLLPKLFKLAAPDTSMAPKVLQGTMVEFEQGLQPRPGDGVLVRDNTGHCYLRVYREKRPGHWEAHPINPAYSPLDSQTDGLTVVAVLTAVAGRWA